MNKFTRTLTVLAASAVVSLGMTSGVMAQVTDSDEVTITVTDGALVPIVTAGNFEEATVANSFSSSGTLTFSVTDNRLNKGNWTGTASVGQFTDAEESDVLTPFDSDIALVYDTDNASNVGISGGVTTTDGPISSAGGGSGAAETLAVLSASSAVTAGGPFTAVYDAEADVSGASATGTYEATVTLTVAGN